MVSRAVRTGQETSSRLEGTHGIMPCASGDCRQLFLHVAKRGVRVGGAVAVDQRRDRLVAVVGGHHDLRGARVPLDVDHVVGDAVTVQLALQSVAVATPRGRVHREGTGGRFGLCFRLGMGGHGCPLSRLRSSPDTTPPGRRTFPMHADDLLSSLDPEQREVATALRGPVRVLAGAGTGKTRAITHRIAYGVAAGVYNPMEVLAVTFTTRAAGEMRTRLRSMGAGSVQARTFHSAALRQVRYFWPKVYGGQPPELTASKIPIVAGAARRNRVEVNQAMLRDLASEIEWAKVSNVRPDDYERVAPRRGREVSGLDAATVAHVFASYEELKREQGRMDMEDVLLIAAALLSEDERVAAEVRRQYKWFVVDEFQDVSPIQSALLDLWLGGRDEICVVGDPAQTIYSFAGASAAYLRDFPRKFPGTTSVELSRNYRSTPEVVEAANTVLAGSASTSVRLRAQRPSGPEVRYTPALDEVAEADAVADSAAALIRDGVPAAEIAVLFRINAQ